VAFSDRPTAVLDAIKLLPEDHRRHWNLERLVQALGKSPQPGALDALDGLFAQTKTLFACTIG
jgi:hypothetical protein